MDPLDWVCALGGHPCGHEIFAALAEDIAAAALLSVDEALALLPVCLH